MVLMPRRVNRPHFGKRSKRSEATVGKPAGAPKIIYLGGLAMGGEPGLIAR
jgi:hypothetical protein